MSHWTVCKINIKNPNMQILRYALEMLAKELGSYVVENFEVKGWNHRRVCQFAIPMKLPYGNGYGIVIENGELKVVVDDHGAPMSATEFANKLTQYYMLYAVMVASQQLGYQVAQVNKLESGAILVDIITP